MDKDNKVLLTIFIILLSSILIGCINQPTSSIYYSIYVWPDENSETTLIVPVILDKKSGEIDQVMLTVPRFSKGNASLEIIETDRGTALKITTNEELQIKFSKYYDKSVSELRENRTISLTEISYDKEQKIMKSWVYLNSTTNHIPHFWISLSFGDTDKSQSFEIGERNVTNGWHQFTVEEGYGIS